MIKSYWNHNLSHYQNVKNKVQEKNILKQFMGRFSVICPLFYPVKLVVYTSSHLYKQTDKIHRCSKSEIIIPVECYIVFSISLVHGGSKYSVQNKGKYPSCIRLFFTIVENKYKHDDCEMTHNSLKNNFWATECSKCISFNNLSPISVIDLHKIVKIKEYNNGDVVYGDLDICVWCKMKYQNMSKNKPIHTGIYDMQKIHKEEYVDENMVWVPLCTNGLRQTLFVDIHSGNRFFFSVNIFIIQLYYDTA